MTLKIIWSEFTETQLDEIYEYYEKKASPSVGKKLLKGIINEPKKLIKAPQIRLLVLLTESLLLVCWLPSFLRKILAHKHATFHTRTRKKF